MNRSSWPVSCLPETSWLVWLTECLTALSTSDTAQTPSTHLSRECTCDPPHLRLTTPVIKFTCDPSDAPGPASQWCFISRTSEKTRVGIVSNYLLCVYTTYITWCLTEDTALSEGPDRDVLRRFICFLKVVWCVNVLWSVSLWFTVSVLSQ